MIGGAPKAQKTSLDKKAKKPSCFKFKKPGHLAKNCPEPPLDPIMKAPKQMTNGTGELTISASREGPSQSKLWLYQLKAHMTEEAWGVLNSSHICWSSLMRNLRWTWES
jgi:hypothetical protein